MTCAGYGAAWRISLVQHRPANPAPPALQIMPSNRASPAAGVSSPNGRPVRLSSFRGFLAGSPGSTLPSGADSFSHAFPF